MNAYVTAPEGDDLSPMAQTIKNNIVGMNGPWIIGCQLSMLYAVWFVL
jgi:hypothetical protein